MAEEGMLTNETPKQTFTFFKGHELGDANSGYLMGTRDSSQLTEQELRDYFDSDEAGMLRQSFGDFDNYLAYMTEREQLLQSGDYDIGSWDEASGALTEDELMLLGGEDLTFYGDDETFEDLEKQRFAERNSAYNNWLNSEQNQALLNKYGVGGKIYNQDGDEYSWNGSAYVKTVKEQAGISDYALAGMAALAGMYAAPAFGSVVGGGTIGGAAGGVASSAMSQLITTGSVDPESLALAAISGAIGGIGDMDPSDMTAFESAIDNAAWDLSGALGVDHATAIRMMQTAGTGIAGGDSLEDVARNLVADYGADVFMANVDLGIDDIEVDNVFGEGTSTINAEAIEGVLANLAQGEDAATVLREFAQDGGLGFLDPTDLDLDLEGDLSFIEETIRAAGSYIDDEVLQVIRKAVPHGTTPDIDLPEVDIDLPEGPGLDLPEGPDIDLPEGPDIDLPGIDLSGRGGGGLSNYTGYMGGIDYQLPQSRMINYIPNQPTDAMQMSEGMLLGMAKNRGRVQ